MFSQDVLETLSILGLFVVRVGIPIAITIAVGIWLEKRLQGRRILIDTNVIIYLTDQVEPYAALSRAVFKGLESAGYAPLLEPHVAEDPFELFGCRVTPIPLLHGPMTTTGYRLADVAYLSDCSSIPEGSLEKLAGLEVLIIDALRYTPHPNHFNIEGALEVVARLRPRRAVFTHLTHEVAYREGDRLPPGVEFAYDGMVLTA